MNKIIIPLLLVVLAAGIFVGQRFMKDNNEIIQRVGDNVEEIGEQVDVESEDVVNVANPASEYCIEKEGNLIIVTENDGNEIALCEFEDYACEEWAFYRGECNIEEDEEAIRQALLDKGLDLSESKVIINTHFGKYIGAGVVPLSDMPGGGYVFAAKTDDGMSILADGNGSIFCDAFDAYPDFPSYLVPECVDQANNVIVR